ncbi:glycosyltransferase family 20-domain-containing protein [Gorgonomyces haynaldii]|nr:glycosyltransferase family 20-domain-containing protein [Gorgonomyces haynaldii]
MRTDSQRILVITHQLPFKFKAEGTDFVFPRKKGHSAQNAGAQSLVSPSQQVVRIGWIGSEIDPSIYPALKKKLWESKSAVAVPLPQEVAEGHYEGYCKSELWPLFHYVLWDNATNGQKESVYYRHYTKVNELFSNVIYETYQEGDIIWIQDYHLLLLPAMLRKRLPSAKIGFFLHTPFPSSEIFRCLPNRTEILSGVLGSNLIGFQTYSHARHFISSCTRVLGLESSPGGVDFHGVNVSIGIFPIGIDLPRVESLRLSDSVHQKMESIRRLFAGKKIIIGRDKLDHIKGVQHKLLAFERFLQMFPQWHNKVAMIQVTSQTQNANPAVASKVSDIVARVNGTFGSLQFVPIHHFHQNLDQDEYFALLSMADVALITALRDGMNTTAHEYIVCQQENKGALILSEFTGSAGSLSGAFMVNPWDYPGVAHAIHDALSMSKEERALKHERLYSHVTRNTADFWAKSFIKELLLRTSIPEQSNPTPQLDFDLVIEDYTKAKKRLLLFDYDGTLTPIVKIPSLALPPPSMLEAMEILTNDPRNVVFVISGRDQQCLDEWLGHIKNLGLSAEHGSFIKYPGGEWINLAKEIDFAWKKQVEEIFNYYEERTQGSFTEHKVCSITWHYRLADPEYGIFQAKECQNHLESAVLSKLPVEILVGKKNLEVRPVSMNKGEIVKRLLQARNPGCDFVLCAGDDRTDEDMFKVIKKIQHPAYHTCTIGSATKKTFANWHVLHPEEMIKLVIGFSKTHQS